MDYSLKSNKKCLSAGNSKDRDPQFHMIKRLRAEFAKTGEPVISIDTKKKELIGPFKTQGKPGVKKRRMSTIMIFVPRPLGWPRLMVFTTQSAIMD